MDSLSYPDEQHTHKWRLTRRSRLTLSCISIVLNAATAGGIFTFPLLSPALSAHLHLTQPQLTSIVLAGLVGQYPFASVVGSIIDNIGPWAASLISAVLFSCGFGFFSLEVYNTPTSVTHFPAASLNRLIFFYFLAGLGTAASYFSALFCASKNFPEYSGMASGGSMAIFGLSPMILSLFASAFFTDSSETLNVSGFTAFLAILTGVVNAVGAINLRVESQDPKLSLPVATSETEPSQDPEAISETSPLLKQSIPSRHYDRAWDVLRDPQFLVLLLFVSLTLSSCEMVISNIGTISLALPGKPVTSSILTSQNVAAMAGTSTATTQVRLLSISNTVSRIVTGTAADFVSPIASYLPSGILALPRQHKISRVAFMWGSSILLVFAFLWMNIAVKSQDQIWVFSIAIGIAYGTVFTIAPSIVSSIWGLKNLARNFGLLTYAPFVGTPLFSYLYAFISSAATEGGEGACEGKRCWLSTFYICTGAAFVATILSAWLWRGWRGKL